MKEYLIKIALRVLSSLLRNLVFTIRSGPAKGLKRRYGHGFKPRTAFLKSPLSAEERLLMHLDLLGKTVYDVGAYIGIYTLFFARAVGETGNVISFEPDPNNYEELVFNVKLNSFCNVTTLNLALGSHNYQAEMFRDPLYPTRSTLQPEEKFSMPRRAQISPVLVPIVSLRYINPRYAIISSRFYQNRRRRSRNGSFAWGAKNAGSLSPNVAYRAPWSSQ